MAPRQAAYLSSHLNGLQCSLAEKGIPLIYKEVSDFSAQCQAVKAICEQYDVTHLFYNYQYEFNERQRDRQLEKILQDVECQGFDDSVMLPPGSVMTGNHEMYKVFTPFKNAFIKRLKEALPECVAAPTVRGDAITEIPEREFDYPQQAFDETLFPATEKTLSRSCASFVKRAQAITTRAGIFPRQRAPAVYRPVWHWVCSLRASACIVFWRNNRRHWTGARLRLA